MNQGRRDVLRGRLSSLGFDVVRFASAAAPAVPGLMAWIDAGCHADMDWLVRSAAKRLDPQLVLPGAQTIVVLGVDYWPGDGLSGRHLARYALHSDYHDTIKAGLVAAGRVLEEFCGIGSSDYRYYVDAGPVMERGWAAVAGVGFRGKNANLISREFGNWLLLAAILVRAEIPADEVDGRGAQDRLGAYCGRCTRCLDACPTKAFPEPGIVDARRCISYHTIENRGFVPRELRAAFGARVFGCDECLEVCPWNRFAQAGRSELLARRHDLADLRLLELLRLTPERFREVFRGTAVKRTKLTGILRNACIAAGNVHATGGDPERAEVMAELLRLVRHESPIVRGHAIWAVRRVLGEDKASGVLADAEKGEADPEVRREFEAEPDPAL